MNKEELIRIARSALDKNLGFEELYYSDYMYGKEKFSDVVWDYVVEAKEIGMKAFDEKYKEYLQVPKK